MARVGVGLGVVTVVHVVLVQHHDRLVSRHHDAHLVRGRSRVGAGPEVGVGLGLGLGRVRVRVRGRSRVGVRVRKG